MRGDQWPELSEKILESDSLVLASPVYFHHFTAQLKKIIDRFRSFLHVQMTENGIVHTPWQEWEKHFVLLMPQGDAFINDSQPAVDLMNFMVGVLGPRNKLSCIIGTGLGIVKQIGMEKEELAKFYDKIGIPEQLADAHQQQNLEWLDACYRLGKELGETKAPGPSL
jgi:hypothetical protein